MVDFSGGKSVDISAPASTDIAVFQNPVTPAGTHEHDIGGNFEVSIDGIQYYGMQDLRYHGTTATGGVAPCHVLIARRITLKGTTDSDYESGCDNSVVPKFGGIPLRLVD